MPLDDLTSLHWQVVGLLMVSYLKARKMNVSYGKSIHLLKVLDYGFHMSIDRKPAIKPTLTKSIIRINRENIELNRHWYIMTYISSRVGWDVNPEIRYFRLTSLLCVISTFTPRSAFLTLTWSESERGLEETSLPKIWPTNSITGSGSMNAADDMSIEQNKHNYIDIEQFSEFWGNNVLPILRERPIWVGRMLW